MKRVIALVAILFASLLTQGVAPILCFAQTYQENSLTSWTNSPHNLINAAWRDENKPGFFPNTPTHPDNATNPILVEISDTTLLFGLIEISSLKGYAVEKGYHLNIFSEDGTERLLYCNRNSNSPKTGRNLSVRETLSMVERGDGVEFEEAQLACFTNDGKLAKDVTFYYREVG